METTKKHDNYPVWMVMVSNMVSVLIYALGFIVMLRLGLLFAVLYLMYVVVLEYRVTRYHCINCYYWGKTCAFGKGRLSSWLFTKGDTSKFCTKNMTWKDMIPDMLVLFIPLITGIVLLIIKFDIALLLALAFLFVLSTSGNGFVRGKLACRYCRQKDLGCPADKLFN
jgi:hypothetical protein